MRTARCCSRSRARRAADCERLPARPDDAEEIGAAVLEAVATSDLVLVIAGSSRGRADHTASVVERHGELIAHGVALRPAHPVALGVIEGTPVIGVPGYPVAAAVAFERFARPLLELLLGALPEDAPLIRVRLIGDVRAKRGVEVYVPLVSAPATDLPNALPQSRKGGALNGLAGAHALLCTRLEDGVLPAGSEVEARLLRPWPRTLSGSSSRFRRVRVGTICGECPPPHRIHGVARLPNALTIARLAAMPGLLVGHAGGARTATRRSRS